MTQLTSDRRDKGIELMHMLEKGHMVGDEGAENLAPAEQCYALAA